LLESVPDCVDNKCFRRETYVKLAAKFNMKSQPATRIAALG